MASVTDAKNQTNQISNENLEKIKKILEVNGKKWKENYKKMIEECEPKVFKELIEYFKKFRLERITDYQTCLKNKNKFSGAIETLHRDMEQATKSLSFILDLPGLIGEKESKVANENDSSSIGSIIQERFKLMNLMDCEQNNEIQEKIQKLFINLHECLESKNLNFLSLEAHDYRDLAKDSNFIDILGEFYSSIIIYLNPKNDIQNNKIQEVNLKKIIEGLYITQDFIKNLLESIGKKLENYIESTKQETSPQPVINLDQQPKAHLADIQRSRSNSRN